jgi:transcriptional regulator with XRE-family HTH domain
MSTSTETPKAHHGNNIRHFRQWRDMKQEALAAKLGGDWTQRKISLLEDKETVEPQILEQVAKALDVPVDALENVNDDMVFYNTNNFHDQSSMQNTNGYYNYKPTFNPVDKIVELLEKRIAELQQTIKEKDELIAKLISEKK